MLRIKSVLAAAMFSLGWACRVAAQPIAEWTFDQPGDLQGWQPNGHLTNVVVTNGVLACGALGGEAWRPSWPQPAHRLGPLA